MQRSEMYLEGISRCCVVGRVYLELAEPQDEAQIEPVT